MTKFNAYVDLKVFDQFCEHLQQYGGIVLDEVNPNITKGRVYCTVQFQYDGDLAAQHAFYAGLNLKSLQSDTDRAVAKLFRYNGVTNSWEFLYKRKSTDKQIACVLSEENAKPPIEKCYRWECYNEAGLYAGKIDTVNTSLF